MTDLMGGQVQVVFNPVPESMAHIRAGKLRPLAVTTATRSDVLPDIPTVGRLRARLRGERGAGHRRAQEHARRDRRQAQRGDQRGPRRSQAEGAASPTWAPPCFPVSPADFGRFMAEETDKWAKVIKFSGAKSE